MIRKCIATVTLSMLCFSCTAEPINTNIVDVTKNNTMSSDVCMVYNAYHEARSGSDMEIIAILNTVMNRVNSKHYPNDICEVIKQKWQYSWVGDNISDVMSDKESVNRIAHIVDTYLLNKDIFISLSEGVDHYHHISVAPDWSKSPRMIEVGIIGEHVFYKRI